MTWQATKTTTEATTATRTLYATVHRRNDIWNSLGEARDQMNALGWLIPGIVIVIQPPTTPG